MKEIAQKGWHKITQFTGGMADAQSTKLLLQKQRETRLPAAGMALFAFNPYMAADTSSVGRSDVTSWRLTRDDFFSLPKSAGRTQSQSVTRPTTMMEWTIADAWLDVTTSSEHS